MRIPKRYVAHFDGWRLRLRRYPYFQGLITEHLIDDLYDEEFERAFQFAAAHDPFAGEHLRLRVYYHIAFARMATRVRGDFLFAGVSYGVQVHATLKAMGDASDGRIVYLIDAWEAATTSLKRGRHPHYCSDLETVKTAFRYVPNARFVVGYIPGALSHLPENQLAFAALNTGDFSAEAASLDELYRRLSPGGLILINGYAKKRQDWHRFREAIGKLPSSSVTNLMNGFGLISKNR
jgi:hypothetical protein